MKLPYEIAEKTVLAVDVGGTNTSLALMQGVSQKLELLLERSYLTKKESSLSRLMLSFLAEARDRGLSKASACCISAAGPLEGRTIKLTNASWILDASLIENETGMPVKLINDFSAIAWGVLLLDTKNSAELLQLEDMDGRKPEPDPGAPILVLGAGTGLGYGFVLRDSGRQRVYASEGGHASLPVYDAETRALSSWLEGRFSFAAGTEAAVSGPGLSNIYEFLAFGKEPGGAAGAREKAAKIMHLEEAKRPEAIALAAEEGDSLCMHAMDIFVRLYARAAADAATVFLPRGGIYLAGGIAAKNARWFTEKRRFMDSFAKGYREHVRAIAKATPVFIVRNYSISLYGDAFAALMEPERSKF